MPALHQRIAANTAGRDFIVGDMHGCLDLFQAQLDRVDFDPTCDRVFSVGDLTDRGPDSIGCLRLLRASWFHAVHGNHEDMLLDYAYPSATPYGIGSSSELFFRNGGRWVLDLDKPEQDELWGDLAPRLTQLPYVITVGEGPARFHVAHAELMTGRIDESLSWYRPIEDGGNPPPKRVLTDAMLNDEMLATMIEPLTWGRRLIGEVRTEDSHTVDTPAGKLEVSHQPWREGLALTYVGHTPLRMMVLHASHLFIDRGAYSRRPNACLLVLEHAQVRQWLAPLT